MIRLGNSAPPTGLPPAGPGFSRHGVFRSDEGLGRREDFEQDRPVQAFDGRAGVATERSLAGSRVVSFGERGRCRPLIAQPVIPGPQDSFPSRLERRRGCAAKPNLPLQNPVDSETSSATQAVILQSFEWLAEAQPTHRFSRRGCSRRMVHRERRCEPDSGSAAWPDPCRSRSDVRVTHRAGDFVAARVEPLERSYVARRQGTDRSSATVVSFASPEVY